MLKSRYLRRLIAFSMILVTIPVVSLGSLSYFKSRGIIQEKVNEGNAQVLIQTQLNVEQLLQTIDNSMIQFINSSLLNQSIQLYSEKLMNQRRWKELDYSESGQHPVIRNPSRQQPDRIPRSGCSLS
ncbi:hypothetical protein KZ483_24555 [Paenibacillus sp. sptzw28]|uniref:hypothetical protein n=1 Tax=Paenibacillus sp. sptzw28 TaxID=715179 RepID=UPI001C6E7663|nr:hypothetical protein [Paenibacillus sp. sptzw28]QYR20888.1 hypothetical protein KZ483_24555 [Paenibacillus sp. sptzw28]